MSDPLKGLGSTVSSYIANSQKEVSQQTNAQALKHWGADDYRPSSTMSRSMGMVQQSMSSQLTATFASTASEGTQSSEDSNASSNKSQNDYSPEKVAQRILSHVGNYMEKLQKQGADDERLNDVFEMAKEAVQKGLEDAKDKLDALGWLTNTGVQQGISDTEQLLSDGFDNLEEAFFSDAASLNTVASLATSMSYQREDYSSIQMKTQEGDVVNLRLYSLQASESGQSANMSDNGLQYSRYENSSQTFAFDFSVEGDLNDDELAAIQDLMRSAGEVSDLFYDGDVAGALQKGLDMGFDTSQLASFSMTLQTTQTMKSSQAVSAYNQNSGIRSIQEPLANYRQALEETVQKASEMFDDFRSVVESTMSDILTMREQQAQKMSDMQQLFEYQQEMIDRISQWLMPDLNANKTLETMTEQPQADVTEAPASNTPASTN